MARCPALLVTLLLLALIQSFAKSADVNAESQIEKQKSCEKSPTDSKSETKGSVFIQVKNRGKVQRSNRTTAEIETKDDCCNSCAGQKFCSPQSGNCYATKGPGKSYYLSCSGGDSGDGDGGLAPSPPPSFSGPACCSACGQSDASAFCSPKSGNCYADRFKRYYKRCRGDDVVLGSLKWADEFDEDGSPDDSKWKAFNGVNPYNNELQFYTTRSENAYVQDGSLKLIAKCEHFEGSKYTSAKLVTKHLHGWGPGHRITVRAKLPHGKGTWPAIWMLPVEDTYGSWPKSGEIDILETVGCTKEKVYGTVHTDAYNHMKKTQKGNNLRTDYSDWHTYTIDWTEWGIKWYVDDQLYHTFSPDTTTTAKWPFNQDFYLILNIAVGGDWGGFCLKQDPSCDKQSEFASPQVMEVDYVRIYSLLQQETA